MPLSNLENTFATTFHTVAQAPSGVARLRELILTLAVQGKLVAQDASDEPASELLKKIRAEKDRMIAEGKIKKDKPLAGITEEEKPFELPVGWEWVRIPEVTYGLGQGEPSEIFTYIDVASIDNLKGNLNSKLNILDPTDAPSRARKYVKCGTVIYSTVRPYLKNIAVLEDNIEPLPIASTAFAVMHPFEGVISKYLLHYLRSQIFTDYVNSKAIGVAYPAINDANFFQGVIPLPPSPEQSRIVARVEELMRLCDALEEKGRLEHTQHQQLLQAMLDSLTQTTDAAELARHWQRLAQHFDLLIDRPEAVDALEQTILQLAVRGLLVPQDPGDEPASELLKKIRAEKHRLIAEGKIKKDKPLPAVREDEKPFELPEEWAWVRLGNIAKVLSGYAFSSEDFSTKSGCRVIKITNAGVGEFYITDDYLPESFTKQYHNFKAFEGDLIIALTRPYISNGLKISMCPKLYHGALINQRVGSVRVENYFNNEFLFIILQSAYVLNIYKERFNSSGLQPNLKVSDVTELLIPLAPLAEQSRIVARVTELRALCQQLREKLSQARTTQTQLAQAWVEQVAA